MSIFGNHDTGNAPGYAIPGSGPTNLAEGGFDFEGDAYSPSMPPNNPAARFRSTAPPAFSPDVNASSNNKRIAQILQNELREDKEQTVLVEFDFRVEDAFLLKLPKVKNVVNTHGFVYEITFLTSEDMRSHVFDFAHDNKLKILQLNQKNASLESLFRDLTSK